MNQVEKKGNFVCCLWSFEADFESEGSDVMGSFVGTYEYSLDSKNRLVVPTPFKELIGNAFIVRAKPGKFSHIDCFFSDKFESAVEAEVQEYVTGGIPRDMALAMSRMCSNLVCIDAHGRITVPAKVLEKAHITKESVFVGMGDKFEIWDTEIYKAYTAILDEQADKLFAAKMAENDKRFEFMGAGYMIQVQNNGIG